MSLWTPVETNIRLVFVHPFLDPPVRLAKVRPRTATARHLVYNTIFIFGTFFFLDYFTYF